MKVIYVTGGIVRFCEVFSETNAIKLEMIYYPSSAKNLISLTLETDMESCEEEWENYRDLLDKCRK